VAAAIMFMSDFSDQVAEDGSSGRLAMFWRAGEKYVHPRTIILKRLAA
jgi:hypothetical protein